LEACAKALTKATERLKETAEQVQRTQNSQLWTFTIMTGMSAILGAMLSIALWLWLEPTPHMRTPLSNTLDPKAVAEILKPEILNALKRR